MYDKRVDKRNTVEIRFGSQVKQGNNLMFFGKREKRESYNPYTEENRVKRETKNLQSKDFWVDDIKLVSDSHWINTGYDEEAVVNEYLSRNS